MRFSELWERFRQERAWSLLEDDQARKLLERWLKAEVIALAGDIRPEADDYFVASQREAGKEYEVSPWACQCPDWENFQAMEEGKRHPSKSHAPHGWCKHRLATVIYEELHKEDEMSTKDPLDIALDDLESACKAMILALQALRNSQERSTPPGTQENRYPWHGDPKTWAETCPKHDKAEVSKFGKALYCPTKVNGAWCSWKSSPPKARKSA